MSCPKSEEEIEAQQSSEESMISLFIKYLLFWTVLLTPILLGLMMW